MEKLVFFICSILLSISVNCQEAQTPVTNNRDTTDQKQSMTASGEPIFTKVEKEAEFPGGTQGWAMHVMKTLDMSITKQKGAPGGIYRVQIKFVVLKSGKIGDCEAITGFGYGMEKEVIRTIKKGAQWMPAQQNGHPVNEYKYQVVTFKVEPY